MADVKKPWDFLTKEQREQMIREIIGYVETELDQKIGVIGAEDMLDFFLEHIGMEIHSKAVQDCKNIIKLNFENLDIDLDQLGKK